VTGHPREISASRPADADNVIAVALRPGEVVVWRRQIALISP